MPKTTTTRQGETVDLVCRRTYGRTRDVTEAVLAANPGLADKGLILPMGTGVIVPDMAPATPQAPLVSLWD